MKRTDQTSPSTSPPPSGADPRRARRRSGRLLLKLVALALIAGGLLYKLRFAAIGVTTHTVGRASVEAEVMGTGTLEARLKTTISPKIQGRLREVLVDQNDTVTTGQLLARLDDAELKEQVAVAEAALNAANATVERVRAEEARAQAVLKLAQLDFARAEDLRRADVAAQADFDKAVESIRVAEAELQRALAAITEADQQRVTASKNLAYHQARLADTELRSPWEALVVRRDRDPGEVVVPGSSILRLISTNELWLSAWVDETAMGRVTTGQTAQVVFRSDPETRHAGTVARLGREADRETREFLVDVRVDELPLRWAVGQRGEVYIHTAREESVVAVPRGFLVWRDGRAGAFVEVRGRAQWRALETGLQGRRMLEIQQGLEAGEVVLRPVPGSRMPLRDGQRVKPAA
ncbi:MAG: efflux RND transporter periplasmic adaptor subunit [Verrucomicrobiales bacterium]|nr:efflux RND transporter periplasmic adaptor subunit [Verrucomicrobiales bacterium]